MWMDASVIVLWLCGYVEGCVGRRMVIGWIYIWMRR